MADGTSLTVTLGGSLPPARIAQLARDLGRDLSRSGSQSRPVEAPFALGDRGEPVTLGVLALALVTSGAVTAVIECLKAYLSRERTLTIKLTRSDGTSVEVNTHNVNTDAVRETLEAAVSARSG